MRQQRDDGPHLVTGVVRDPAGRPVPDARVYLVEGPGPFPDIAALTGDDGRFTLSVSVPGTYTVQCRSPDERVSGTTVEVGAESGPAHADIRIPP